MEIVDFYIIIFSLTVITVFFVLIMKMSEPLIFCFALILFACSVSVVLGSLINRWICYAILLIFLGGIIVIFLYVSTLSLSNKIITTPTPSSPLLGGLVLIILSLRFTPQINFEIINSLVIQLYQEIHSPLLIFLVRYLLLTLLSVVKITQSFKGALLKQW